MKGGDAAFARACGEYARNDAFRSLNETIISNVGRDKDRGVRFARVPTGFETCTFCIMLASRGAVYHTRKSAGEFKHFHRHCDCKVVPGFEDDPDAELVEGVNPEELRDLWAQFKDIDCYRQWKIGQLRYCKLPNGVTPVYPTSTTPSQPSYGSLLLSVGTSLSL